MSNDFDTNTLEEFDDDSFEYIPFYKSVQQTFSPDVKEYLFAYYGEERMGQLEPATYIELKKTIEQGFIEADMIPDLLYNHRSISHDEFDAALEAYIPKGNNFSWPRPEYWFDRDYTDKEAEDDTFLEDSDPIDLSEEQRSAKKLIEHIVNMQEETANFAEFVKKGFDILIPKVQQYMENVARFDLEILTVEGFEKLQQCISSMISELLSDLYGVVESDFENKI